jgi:Ca2+-binding RTX toxin-like protein
VFFPPQPWTANYFGTLSGSGSTQFHVTPVQHRSESSTMTRRKFNGMSFRLFYSSNTASYCGERGVLAPCPAGEIASTPALSAPPTISNVGTSFSGGVLTFTARVVGDNIAGIQSVWVTHTSPPGPGGGAGAWQSIQLQQDANEATLWKGTLTTANPGAIDFMVQAVSGVGRVTLDSNLGAFYRHGSLPGPPPPGQDPPAATSMAFEPAPPSQVRYGAAFNVTVDLDGSAACIGSRPVRVDLGGVSLPGTTNANGTATVEMRAAVLPGTYPITATFAGTPTCGPSDAAATVQVVPQQTSLSFALPVVTLTASTSPPTPLHDRTVIVTVLQGSVPRLVHVGRTDPQGRVLVPQSLLATLAQGGYTLRADYAGEPGYTPATVGGGALNVIRRGAGNDTINGTPGHDLILDAGGNNTINGSGGNDTIIVEGTGNNVVNGGAGHDTITTGVGNDSIQGGDGDDTIDAGAGMNTVNAGSGNDWVTTGAGNDSIQGGDGNDTINAGNGNNTVSAGAGNDFITTGSGNDVVDGGSGFDFCLPGAGNNSVRNCEG